MVLNEADVQFEATRGTGPGGQHKNKSHTAIRATHVPTGITVTIDSRSQSQNKREALAELERRLDERKAEKRASKRKARRDQKIHDKTVVRSYRLHKGVVKDHRTGKVASAKDVLEKGKLELIAPEPR